MGLRARAVVWTVVLLSALSDTVSAQALPLSGYMQTISLAGTAHGQLSEFNRVRVSSEPVAGPFALGLAYEHVLTFRRLARLLEFNLGAVPGGGEWLELQWTIAERDHVVWQHRFDRLYVGWENEHLEISVGRQAVSWGTALFLTPSDPFAPFGPADPFRVFRAGVDAARLRVFPGPLSEIDVVVRATQTEVGEEVTALGRGLTTWRNWELSGWAGSLYGSAAGAVGATGALGPWAVRAEVVTRARDDTVVVRGTMGVDRQFQLGRRDAGIVVEYQHDGLGAASVDEYAEILASDTFRRGEHQVLGRDETVLQLSYQAHPLWSLAGLWLWNLNDRSALLAPSFSYSAADEATISGGVFVGLGAGEPPFEGRPFSSEYGASGTTGYLSMSWFF